MTAKACEQYAPHCRRRKVYHGLFACLVSLLILILFIILIIWLVLRPTKPKFYLRDVTVSQFNLTEPSMASNLLSTNLQVTVSSRNPNDRISVYYDHLDVYAVYKNQQVTVPTALPTTYQGHNDFAVWSPFLYGTAIPVSPYLAEALSQDENAGFLLVEVRVDGKLRWKVGSWVSGHYHIYVNCPAFLTVGNGNGNWNGKWSGGGWGFKFQQTVTCHVEV